MEKHDSQHADNYRKIASSTIVFGGAQVFNILANVLRGKFVATILHSVGVGMLSLYSNAANGVQQLAMMGINVSSVRNISQAAASANPEVLAYTVRIVRRLIVVASLLGLVLTASLSPVLSRMSFDSAEQTFAFIMLGLVVMFNILGAGEMAVLQGLRRYRTLALCSIVPSLCGLLLSIPIYYLWGLQSIVPAMILSSAVYYVIIRHFSHKYQPATIDGRRITLWTAWREGRDIVKFGLVMTIGAFMGTAATYLLSAFISHKGSVSDVGYYQAANVVTVQYIGLVFTAMATDYFPHLSALLKESIGRAHHFVNQQTEVVLLIITPLSMLIILTAPQLISLLLTDEFQPIKTMMRFMGLASIFKALCFPMDYMAYAKADKRYIFWIETMWSNAKTFAVMAGSYWLFGLEGLGYGALLSAFIDSVVTIVLVRWRYRFVLSRSTFRLLAVMLAMALVCFIGSCLPPVEWRYSVMALSTLVCCIYSYRQLNRRIDIRSLYGSVRQKLFHRNANNTSAHA